MEETKKISFLAAVLMNINTIVGSGIYIYPPLMAQAAGGLSFLTWAAAGLLLLPIVLTIAQAARIFPGEGGFYNYCTTALGQDAGFIANWAYLLGYMGTVATLVSVVRDQLSGPIGITFIREYPVIFYFVFIMLISLLNMISIRLISKIQSVITLLKLIPLMLMFGLIYFYWNSSFDYQVGRIGDLGGTIPFALFSFLGFESCCNISHYIRGGSTKASKVILLAFSISVLLYTVFHLGVLHIMGAQALATQGVHALPLFMGLPQPVAHVCALILLGDMTLSYINTSYGASLNNVTNINVLAKSGLLLESGFLAKLNRFGMPANASLVHAVCIFALILFIPSTVVLSALTNLGVCVAFFLTMLAVFVQSWRKKYYGSYIIAALGFVSVFTLFYLNWTTKMGADNFTRMLYAAPIIIGIPAGYLMYRSIKMKYQNIDIKSGVSVK